MRSRRASEKLQAKARASKAASRDEEAESAAEMAQAAAAEEAKDAVAGLAIGLSSAALDAALSAVAAAAEASVRPPEGEDGRSGEGVSSEVAGGGGQPWQQAFASWATDQRDTLRDASEAEERTRRLRLFEAELTLLGIPMEEASRLDDKQLRQAFRRRSRELHPDARAAAGESAPMFDGAGEPTIYDLNEAYTAVRKVLW